MEDYYRLIGVSPDADREVIRDAYRVRKGELDATATDDARAEASRLNRAWNVLSDERQRDRYDAQLADAKANGSVEEYDDDDEPAPARGWGARGARGARQRSERPMRQAMAQETEMNGVPLAANRDRAFAMAIDGFVLFFFVLILPQFVVPPVADAQKPEVVDQIEVLNDERDARVEEFRDKEDEIDAATESNKSPDEIAALEQERDELDDQVKALDDEIADEQKKLSGIYFTVVGVAAFLALLVFAIPAGTSGKTPGKALRRVRLRRETGELPGVFVALRRYVPIVVVVAFGMLLGPVGLIALMVVLFGVTSYTRNPRRQGWHDRWARTIVAAD